MGVFTDAKQGSVRVAKRVTITVAKDHQHIRVAFTGEAGAGKTLSRRKAEDLLKAAGATVVSSGDDQDDHPAVLTDILVIAPGRGMDVDSAFNIAWHAARQAATQVA